MAQGGLYEIIHDSEAHLLAKLDYANSLLRPQLGVDVFSLQNHLIPEFGLNPKVVRALVKVEFCGTLDSGFILTSQLRYFSLLGGSYFTNCEYIKHSRGKGAFNTANARSSRNLQVLVKGNSTSSLSAFSVLNCDKLVFATNSFSKKYLPEQDIVPGRGQILLTKPISNLKIRGSFAFEFGYFYFRNFGPDRILIGGGRNQDFKGEETFDMKTTPKIINTIVRKLAEILNREVSEIEIEKQWAGLMAFATDKNCYKEVLSRRVQKDVYLAARLGGMGITMTPYVGEKMADLVLGDLRIGAKL